MSSIMVCGSRKIATEGVGLVHGVVQSVMGSGRSLSVGCAVGVDAVALAEGVRIAADRVRLFSAFGPGGAGAVGQLSNVVGGAQALSAGVAVEWWSGGGPQVPVRARLVNRSLACVHSVMGGGLVAVVSSLPSRPFGRGVFPSCGSGSWSAVAAAVQLGLPVVVFPVGLPSRALPSLPVPGQWVSAGSGVWSQGWKWSVNQVNIFS